MDEKIPKLKLIKKFLWIIVVVIVLVVTLILTLSQDVKTFSLTTIKKSYCYVSTYNETQEMEVLVYLSSKKSFVTEKDKISHAYIQSENRDDKLLLQCLSVNDKNQKEKIKGKNFYLYSFVFDIPLQTSEEYDLLISDAVILLEYPNEELEIAIGSFYFYKVPYYGDKFNNLSISKIKPIVNYVYVNKTLTALNIGFRNNTTEDLTIKKIKLFDGTCYPSIADIKETTIDISTSVEINSVLGYKYNPISNNNIYTLKTNLLIPHKEKIEYVIPLKYLDDYIISSVGFMITYELDGQDYNLYYDNVILFTDVNRIVDVDSLEIMTYENK